MERKRTGRLLRVQVLLRRQVQRLKWPAWSHVAKMSGSQISEVVDAGLWQCPAALQPCKRDGSSRSLLAHGVD